jgi:hypothetical protein
MTLLAYVWIDDAIMCMVDSKTTDTSSTGKQASLTTVKSKTYPVGVAGVVDGLTAVLMFARRSNFTPEHDNKPIGPSSTAHDIAHNAVTSAHSTFNDVDTLGETVWPSFRKRMYDCSYCRKDRDKLIAENKASGYPELEDGLEADGCARRHSFDLHIAGFQTDQREAVRYRRFWHDGRDTHSMSMTEGAVYLSCTNGYLDLDPPSVEADPGEPLNEDSRLFSELKSVFTTTANLPNMTNSVGGDIQTTVITRNHIHPPLAPWRLEPQQS